MVKPKRETKKISQEALAEAIKQNVGTLRRWENCHEKAKKDVPYGEIAEVLGESALQLCEDHACDLRKAGLVEHAEYAEREAVSIRRQQCFSPIDPSPIQARLESCADTGLISGIGKRKAELKDSRRQAAKFAQWLQSNELDNFLDAVSLPLQEAIDTVARRSVTSARRTTASMSSVCVWPEVLTLRQAGEEPGP